VVPSSLLTSWRSSRHTVAGDDFERDNANFAADHLVIVNTFTKCVATPEASSFDTKSVVILAVDRAFTGEVAPFCALNAVSEIFVFNPHHIRRARQPQHFFWLAFVQ